MNSRGLSESEYDGAGDFYYNFIKAQLSAPDSFFHQNVEIMMRMLGDVKGLRVCDLACGEGFLARILAAQGANVTGVDLSVDLLQHAARQSNGLAIEYVRDDAQSLVRVDDASFDTVVCHMALMDIPDLDATIHSAYRILQAGGLFVFCVLHPCFETPFDAGQPPHEVDDEGNLLAIRVTRYSEEGKWFSDGSGVRGTLGSIHRMLSTYLNSLIGGGFAITEISEPTIDPTVADTFDRQLRSVAPRVLIVKAKKPL